MACAKSELLKILIPYRQEHILSFWDALSEEEREALERQVRSIDFRHLEEVIGDPFSISMEGVTPPEEDCRRLPYDEGSRGEWERARCAGQEAMAAGRVAAMVVAGGQGTRLRYDPPKGTYQIGPITNRTLFQIHAEKVLAASRRYGREIPFLVMTGPSTDAETRYFFNLNGYFGLPHTSVRIFQQREMPAVDDGGRVILDGPGHIFTSPNGHGGSLSALWESGTVKWLEERGIDLLSYFQVDNPLVKIVDPAFVGWHVLTGAEMSLKLLMRTDPEEKLGIWVRAGGQAQVIEYSDMPKEAMGAKDASGRLLYSWGSIGIHVFSTGLVRRLAEKGFQLPYHRALKKVPYVDASGQTVSPSEPNATKFEMFVFDALRFTEKATAVETSREEEFSPVKWNLGQDSPETARRDMSRLYAKWLEYAGVEAPRDEKGSPVHQIEISPLVGDCAESLAANYRGPRRVDAPLVVKL